MINNNKSKIGGGGGDKEWREGDTNRTFYSQSTVCDHNSLKIRQGKITTLQITTMENYKVSSFER